MLLETWLRISELTDLRWDAIDLERGTLTVFRTVTKDADRKQTSGTPKTKASRRTMPLSTDLGRLLRLHGDGSRFRRADHDLVFPGSRSDSWLRQPSVAYALRVACEAVTVPGLTPHELRHTGTTLVLRQGINVKVISERSGHSDVAISMRVYVHRNEAEHQSAADKIASFLADS